MSWQVEAERRLIQLRRVGAGWSYQANGESMVEPTVLACWALMSLQSGSGTGPDRQSVVQSAAAWLTGLQNGDGSLGLSESIPRPGWPTALATLLWSQLDGFGSNRAAATEWLLGRQGKIIANGSSVVGHDTSLRGWPWVDATHSWLEPTCFALMALCREGLCGHPRVGEGHRLVIDRAIDTGGWNYGNKSVFGSALRPRPAPTGIALVTLAQLQRESAEVSLACDYLLRTLPTIRSPQSFCWARLGLGAWDREPARTDEWLGDAYRRFCRRGESEYQIAYLLLATNDHSVDLLHTGKERSGRRGGP